MEDKLRKPFQDNFLKALSNLLIYNTGNSLYSYNYSFKKKISWHILYLKPTIATIKLN